MGSGVVVFVVVVVIKVGVEVEVDGVVVGWAVVVAMKACAFIQSR